MSMKYKRWTESELASLKIEFGDSTLLPDVFEKKYGVGWGAVAARARQLGLRRGKETVRRTKSYNLPKEEIRKLYVELGFSTRKIAKIYGCSFPTVSALLKTMDVQVKGNIETVKKYDINQDYFESIDSHEKAYFLGFIVADGYVHKGYGVLNITLQVEDHEILDNLKTTLNYTGNVVTRNMKSSHDGTYVNRTNIQVVNRKLVTDLAKWGVVQKKSYILAFPDIDPQYYCSFILGFFDGDGCVHKSTDNCPYFSFSSCTKSFIERCQQILMENCQLAQTKLDDSTTAWKCRYGGRIQLQRIFNFLYSKCPVKLERKYQQFCELLSTP